MTAHPRSVRFDDTVAHRLSCFVTRHPELTGSAAVNRFVDEGLRMEEHPGVLFRPGPAGRRAVLVAGPDVWEVVRAVRNARAAGPDLDGAGVLDLVATNTGVARHLVDTAMAYWAAYPDEVDAAVADADHAEAAELAAWRRTRELLSS
jgi:hypothetical protein